ncbi:hypothetical protein H5T88_08055 [bacterium]|nr:hypothetical protein [bacterium]
MRSVSSLNPKSNKLANFKKAISLFLLFLAMPSLPSLRIDCSFYHPDPTFPYEKFNEGFKPAGFLEIYVENRGNEPLRIEDLQLNEEIVWWRLRPDPLPPKSFGEILIRLRNHPQKDLRAKIKLTDSSAIEISQPPNPPTLSLETLAFDENISKIYLFLKGKPSKIKEILLDGYSLLKRSKILGFWKDFCLIIVSLTQPLRYGSFHYLRLDTDKGERIAFLFRARDDFFPLGSYGYVTPEAYAQANCNIYASFSALSKEQLDKLGKFNIKGISSLGGESPPKEIISHPFLWAYYLWDEPDVADYFVESLPHPLRVGSKAVEMVKRERNCYNADKNKLTFLTIDMTYKPANWFVYGRIADVTNTDPYALAFGAEMRLVYDVSEILRLASSPSMPLITYQAYFRKPKDKPSDWKYPRMPSPEEEKIMMHYALAGGAKGLLSYIHCTEHIGKNIISYGAEDYPEVWKAIGDVYKNLSAVSHIISRTQPMDIVQGQEGVFARALVADDAMLIVCINEKGKSEKEGYISHPIENLRISVELPPWFKPKKVEEIRDGEFHPLPFKIGKEGVLHFLLPTLHSATLVLLE